MPSGGRRPVRRLQLGPIVGHTDHESSRVWIRVFDDPASYTLRVASRGVFPFESTENGATEFGTAIATAAGLRPSWRYRYQVLRKGRVVPGGSGSFRTLPSPGSLADVQFVVASCSHQIDLGLWHDLAAYVESAEPRFLLLIGDQVYLDDGPNLWDTHLDARSYARRRAMAEKYQQSWSRDPVRRVLARIPTYMMWDDHDVRDGWGSLAPDSPTLASRYPAGARIFERWNRYFEDARAACWHFQLCHNPLNGPYAGEPLAGERKAMPFAVRCGRVMLFVLDSRGDRDLWRESDPVLGSAQWDWLLDSYSAMPEDVDAIVVVTAVPIVAMSPSGAAQTMVGSRTDDVDLFKEGKEAEIQQLRGEKGSVLESPLSAAGGFLRAGAGIDANFGSFRLSDIDDARDQWSNHFSLREQERLLRETGRTRTTNRSARRPRAVLFVGGDLHSGGRFRITCDAPEFEAPCLISSGIGQKNAFAWDEPHRAVLVNEDFTVAPGIRAELQNLINDYNFGVVQILPNARSARIIPGLVTTGGTNWWGFG